MSTRWTRWLVCVIAVGALGAVVLYGQQQKLTGADAFVERAMQLNRINKEMPREDAAYILTIAAVEECIDVLDTTWSMDRNEIRRQILMKAATPERILGASRLGRAKVRQDGDELVKSAMAAYEATLKGSLLPNGALSSQLQQKLGGTHASRVGPMGIADEDAIKFAQGLLDGRLKGPIVATSSVQASTSPAKDEKIVAGHVEPPARPAATALSLTDDIMFDLRYCDTVVATLRPADVTSYRAKSSVDKLGYCKQSFSTLFRWDRSTEQRREVVARTRPRELAAFDRLNAEEQVQFCLQQFGATGLVLDTQFRQSVRDDALAALGHKPTHSEAEYVIALGEELSVFAGIRPSRAQQAEQQAKRIALSLLASAPRPPFGEELWARLLSKLSDEVLQAGRPKAGAMSPDQANGLALLRTMAKGDANREAELVRRFSEVRPDDVVGDLQLRQAELLLGAAETIMRNSVWPSPIAEWQLGFDPATFKSGFIDLYDPGNGDDWSRADSQHRAEEILYATRLIAYRAERLLREPNAPSSELLRLSRSLHKQASIPRVARHYFGSVVGEVLDDAARNRLTRAALVFDTAWLLLFETTYPSW